MELRSVTSQPRAGEHLWTWALDGHSDYKCVESLMNYRGTISGQLCLMDRWAGQGGWASAHGVPNPT
jgi:hypothetical protein